MMMMMMMILWLRHSSHLQYPREPLNAKDELHHYTVHQYYQPLHYPTNALTRINFVVIKNTLKYKNCSYMFRFTQEPSSGSKCQYLAKITNMVLRGLSIRTGSVLWRHMPYGGWLTTHHPLLLNFRINGVIPLVPLYSSAGSSLHFYSS